MNIQLTKDSKFRRKLIAVDLDGTMLLKDFSTLHPKNEETLRKLKQMGHVVCIFTGRNSPSAEPYYYQIGLDTPLSTYNGAYISFPSLNNSPLLKIEAISNSMVHEILLNKTIKENLLNFLIDPVDRKTISTSEDPYYENIFFNGNQYTKMECWKKENSKEILDKYLKNQDCLQLVLEFPFFQGEEIKKLDSIILALGEYKKVSINYDWGLKMKAAKKGDKILVPDNSKIIFKIRSLGADKFEAVKSIACYYGIHLNDVIAFGNDVNDVKMIKMVGQGIAVSNSDINLKVIASGITDLPSYEGGVADFLNKYLLKAKN